MFVSDDLPLIGNLYLDHSVLIKDDRLAAQPAFDTGVDRPVDKVFFLVTDFFQCVLPAVHVDVAGRTGADLPTVVVKVDLIFFGSTVFGAMLLSSKVNFTVAIWGPIFITK